MQVHTFIADSAPDAVAQIRAQLGPQAVVLNVRPLAGEGIARLWQKRRIEVLAYLPEAEAVDRAPADPLAQLRRELSEIRQKVQESEPGWERGGLPATIAPAADELPARPGRREENAGAWRVGAILQNSGLLPVHAERVVDELRALHGDAPPLALAKEMELAGALLRMLWNQSGGGSGPRPSVGTHVLVGAPGAGKTVCLSKWLAQTVLLEGRSATVWRLDGRTANTAESLSVYAEILNVPVHRALPEEGKAETDLLLVDLPGVDWTEPDAVEQLRRQVEQLPSPTIHLVLNAAYESSLLLSQVRAFARLPVADLIITHLDEESRWGKLWNLALGTNFSIRYLSAGQNIPGDWRTAAVEEVLARQFPRK